MDARRLKPKLGDDPLRQLKVIVEHHQSHRYRRLEKSAGARVEHHMIYFGVRERGAQDR